jgi:hypothetical protein
VGQEFDEPCGLVPFRRQQQSGTPELRSFGTAPVYCGQAVTAAVLALAGNVFSQKVMEGKSKIDVQVWPVSVT